MHFHNLFLVKAVSKTQAIKKVEAFLETYNENTDVEEYKNYLTEREIQSMAEYYKVDVKDVATLAEKMEEWNGVIGKVDEKGLYYLTTYNKQAEWDWYQIGGRWLWNNLDEKYKDYIFRPKKDEKDEFLEYWNPYYDTEVIGKTVTIEFPDRTSKICSYGSDVEWAIKHWVGDNPEQSEVIDATDTTFFDKIEHQLKSRESSINFSREQLKEYQTKDPKSSMIDYYQKQLKIHDEQKHWQIEDYFWNVELDSLRVDKDEILKNPKQWFLVNVDLHS